MREKLRQIRNKFLSGSGFTLVETLISVAIVSVVILSLVATSTFSLSFSRMEKARTLAQDISRNVMSQHVRTVKFADLKNKMGGSNTKSEVLFLALNNTVSINKLGQTSSLSEDLRKLNNAKCEMVMR